jgi:thiol-disulfide isomerase/thioredoxin
MYRTMKKTLFFTLGLAGILLVGCQSKALIVKGTITGFDGGTVVYLLHNSDEGFLPVDSTVLSTPGGFSLKTEAVGTGRYALFVGNPNEGSMFYKEFFGAPDHTVRITGDHRSPQSLMIESDIPEQVEWNRFDDAVREPMSRLEEASFRLNELSFFTPSGEAEALALRQEADSLQRLADVYRWQKDSITLELIAENPHTDKALDELAQIVWGLSDNPRQAELRPRVEETYGKLTLEQQESSVGKGLYDILFLPQAKEGGPLIDTDLVDLQGGLHRLAEYAGKYLLLDFWASWCGPCISTFPELRAFAEQNADAVTVIGINIDERPEKWAEASAEHDITWVNWGLDPRSSLSRQYGVVAIPHAVLVSPQGIILRNGWRYQRGSLEEEFLKIKNQ